MQVEPYSSLALAGIEAVQRDALLMENAQKVKNKIKEKKLNEEKQEILARLEAYQRMLQMAANTKPQADQYQHHCEAELAKLAQVEAKLAEFE